MNSDLEKKLLAMKDRNDKKEREGIQAEGALKQLQTQMEKEFEIFSLEAAEALLDKWIKEDKELEKGISDKIEDIESKYEL